MDRQDQDSAVAQAEAAAADRPVCAVGLRRNAAWTFPCRPGWLAVVLLAALPLRAELAQVHVDHSVAARDLLNRCNQLVRTDAAQAIRLLGELLERHGNEVVEVEPGLYGCVGRVAWQQAAGWPEEAVRQLQHSWEPLAAERWQALASSPDIAVIERFARRHLFTATGAQAAERAARLALEAGQADLARLYLEDLLRDHPQRQIHGGRWHALLAAGRRLAGEEPGGKPSPSAAQSQQASGGDSDEPASLPALSAATLRALRPLPPTATQPAGFDEKGRPTVLWQANLTDRPGYGLARRQMPPHWLPKPQMLSQPDFVLIQWDRHCFAFDPATGAVIWDYCPLGERQAVRAGVSGPTMPRRPAVDRRRVYAVSEVALPQDEPGPIMAVQALSCLDGGSGRPYWVRAVGEMMSREVPTILDGTPVAGNGRVFVAARIARTNVYNEVFVLQIDARSGQLLRRSHLFGLGRVEQMPTERLKPIRLALGGGVLYVVSPAGAAAAIDVDSLEPIWVRSFKPQSVTDVEDGDEVREPAVPALWADEPLLLDGRLIVPAEASLHVIDALSGEVLRSVDLEGPIHALSPQPAASGQVAAIAKRWLYVIDSAAGTVVQKIDLGRSAGIGGMCALAGGRLLVCVENQLRVVGPDGSGTNLAVDLLPAGIPVLAKGRLYLGTNGYLACVGDSVKPLAELQLEMKTSESPLPALRMGELALRADRADVALQALRTAVQQGAADVSRSDEAVVQRLLETCLTFASFHANKRGEEGQRTAEQLLEIARQCATQPREKIQVCAILAEMRLARRKPADAIAAYQAILADPVLRAAPLPEDLGGHGNGSAGQWAQVRIGEVIGRFGQGAYAEFDAQAAKMLEGAKQGGGTGAIDQLLQVYPNSRHVPETLLERGRLALRAGDVVGALALLRRAAESGDVDTRGEAMAALASGYEVLGNIEAAATWASRLASEMPERKVGQAGQVRSAKEYAEQMVSRLPRTTPAVCHVSVPLQSFGSRTLSDAVSLLGEPGNGADCPLVLAWTAGSLCAVDPLSLAPAWKQPLAFRTQPAVLTRDGNRFVLHDSYCVMAVEASGGRIVWTWKAGGPAPEGPNVDPEAVPVIKAAAISADLILVLSGDDRATCLAAESGQVRWERALEPAFVASLTVSQELAVYRGSLAGQVVYRVIEIKSGRDVSLIRPGRDVPAETVEILPAAVVLVQGVSAVEAYDAYSGRLAWQVPAKNRFRPAVRARQGTAYYVADGERTAVKIDTLTGRAAWRTIKLGRTGESLCILAAGSRVWMVDARGVHEIEDASGKVLQTTPLSAELAGSMDIVQARACEQGLLCLATARAKAPAGASPAAAVLFGFKGRGETEPIVSLIEQVSGLVSGWHVRDQTVLIAAGNRLIGLHGRAAAAR